MYQIPTNKYWNTWSAKSPAMMVFLPADFTIAIGANSFALNGEYTNFPFTDQIKLFEHHPDGNYCRLQMAHGGTVLELEYVKVDAFTVIGKIRTVKSGEWGLRFQTLISFGFEKGGQVGINEGSFQASFRSYQFAIALKDKPIKDCYVATKDCLGEAIESLGYYTPMPVADEINWYSTMYNLEETPEIVFSVSVSSDYQSSKKNAEEALDIDFEKMKKQHFDSQPKLSLGENQSAMSALRDVMAWNTIADSKNKRVFTSLTRFWIDKKFGGWFVWLDDVLMHGLMNAFLGDWTMARNCILAAMGNVTPEGNLACLMSEFTEWVDRSQPPLASFIVLKYYQITGDRQLLEEIYPTLLSANAWWYRNRDGNGNGVLEYGSSQVGEGHFVGTKLAAKDEAAMDNSPMYDKARFVEETNTINMEDIALNSLLTLDGECLSMIGEIVGDKKNSKWVLQKSKDLGKRVDETLWDDSRSIYANKHWEEGFVCPSPTSFYPLAAGIPKEKRIDRLIEHIFDENEFWTNMPLPSVWIKEEAVHDNVYWRGRAWPPLNFVTYIGLKRYGKYKDATKLLDKIMFHFTRLWENERACYENHNTFTGEGNDSVDTDPFYGWGALYPLMWILEHLDVDPWNGWHFGSPLKREFELNDFKMKDGYYSLKCNKEGTILKRDGQVIVETNAVGRFTHFFMEKHYVTITVPPQDKNCRIILGDESPIKVVVNGAECKRSHEIDLEKGVATKIEIYK